MFPKPQFESTTDILMKEPAPKDWVGSLNRSGSLGNYDDPNGPIEINPTFRPPVDQDAVIREGGLPPLSEDLPNRYGTPVIQPTPPTHSMGIRMQDVSFKQPVSDTPVEVQKPTFWEKISPTNTLWEFLRPEYTKEPALKDVQGVVGKVPANQLDVGMVAAGGVSDLVSPLSGKTALMLGPLGIRNLLPPEHVNKALSLLRKGASEETLTRQTGMFRGVDGQIRYEMPDWDSFVRLPLDKDGKVVTDTSFQLNRIFDHPELYRAYPEAKDLTFKFVDKINGSPTAAGVFDKTVGKEGEIQLIKGLAHNQDYVKSVVLHELQHFIQRKEGFKYQGSNPAFAFDNVMWELYDKWRKAPDSARSEIESIVVQLNKQEKDYAHRLYRMEPGEIEARLVQERRDMDPEFLRLLTPKEHLEWLQKKQGQDWIPLKTRQ